MSKRILLNLTTVTSLLLCVAALVAWWRSWRAFQVLTYTSWNEAERLRSSWGFTLFDGRLFVERDFVLEPSTQYHNAAMDGWDYYGTTGDDLIPSSPRYFSWFQYKRYRDNAGGNYQAPVDSWSVGVRLWPVAVTMAVIPSLSIWRRICRKRNSRLGFCPRCGYDLRATPDRCPECGEIPVQSRFGVAGQTLEK